MIHETGADPTLVTYQVTILLFKRHLFSKEIKKEVVGAKNIESVRHARTLVQEKETKLESMKV